MNITDFGRLGRIGSLGIQLQQDLLVGVGEAEGPDVGGQRLGEVFEQLGKDSMMDDILDIRDDESRVNDKVLNIVALQTGSI